MRLIDADALFEAMAKACGEESCDECIAEQKIGDCVVKAVMKAAPIVFDIDKLIELIEADYEGLMKALEIAEATAAVKDSLKAKLLENETVQAIIHQCRG